MDHSRFISALDEERIVATIETAERGTTGQIRVFITERTDEDPLDHAKGRFLKLKMDETLDRNAVLIYFAPRSNRFAVVGDVGIHARCGDEFWERLTQGMSRFLREEQFTDAVVLAVKKCGRLLRTHFPHPPGGTRTDLPNDLERD